MPFHSIHDDPEIKIERWEHQQARKAGVTIEQWRDHDARRLRSVSSSSRTSEAQTDANELSLLPLLALICLGVATFPTIVAFVASTASTLTRWLTGPLVPVLCGGLAIAVAKSLHVLRTKKPTVYGVGVLLGSFAISTAVGLKLQSALSVDQALALLGASFGAVDGFHALRSRADASQETPRK